jgi:hypothetical protein
MGQCSATADVAMHRVIKFEKVARYVCAVQRHVRCWAEWPDDQGAESRGKELGRGFCMHALARSGVESLDKSHAHSMNSEF